MMDVWITLGTLAILLIGVFTFLFLEEKNEKKELKRYKEGLEERFTEREVERIERETEFDKRYETLCQRCGDIAAQVIADEEDPKTFAIKCFIAGVNATLEAGFVKPNRTNFIVERIEYNNNKIEQQ